MGRYLLHIHTLDEKTGRTRHFWCVFSTSLMECLHPPVEADSEEEAKEKIKKYTRFMGISELEKEALHRGYLSEAELKEYQLLSDYNETLDIVENRLKETAEEIAKKIRNIITDLKEKHDKVHRKYWEKLEKYNDAIDRLEKELNVKGYNDRYVEDVKGKVIGNKVVYEMQVYQLFPAEE